jgi:hypothetical protein
MKNILLLAMAVALFSFISGSANSSDFYFCDPSNPTDDCHHY